MATSILKGAAYQGTPDAAPQPRAASDQALGVSLGRIGSVEIRLDWSLIFVFILITVNLGAGLFPLQHPEWSPVLVWAMALIAAMLFFASVLAHELAHALMARRHGLQVDSITLFLLGGMARIRDEPKRPGVEFWVAIVGPITSLVIGAVALLLAIAALGAPFSVEEGRAWWMRPLAPAATLLLWLGPINILLAVFNLLPAFPLDGGRVLRAILWRTTGDLERATRWASGVGRAVALLLIFAGVLMIFGRTIPLLGGGLVQGLWLILIGWFLNAAAINGYQQVVVRRMFAGLPVARLMRPLSPPVSMNSPIDDVVDRFLQAPAERCLPVVDHGTFEGLVCLSDLTKVPRQQWGSRTVGEIMTPVTALTVATPAEDATHALRKLAVQDVDQLPVVEEGEVRGVVRRADLIRWMELHGASA